MSGSGIYDVSLEPVWKYELSKLVADEYGKNIGKNIEIEPYDDFRIARSLNSERFRRRSGYKPPDWRQMIRKMHEHYVTSECYR